MPSHVHLKSVALVPLSPPVVAQLKGSFWSPCNGCMKSQTVAVLNMRSNCVLCAHAQVKILKSAQCHR